ncbi:MAG TPA: hydantoinase/oxoprolinase family protein [Thermomicrobiales bacterium]|nr:hydantoinase/oxoprolinase family protein [Thermomicrobiales bacterium]
MRIGVDVGGTNTDAVLLGGEAGRAVLAAAKRPTTADVTGGILAALTALLDARPDARRPGAVTAVMVGTTHFTNAVVQRQGLVRTAALRLCLPAAESVPPLEDWPPDLRAAVAGDGGAYLLHGGFEFDGRPISAPDPDELDRVADRLAADGVEAVAISGVFAPVDASQEEWAAARLRARLPGLDVTLSHEIGRLGLLERENAAILNACLAPLARRTIAAFREAIGRLGLDARLYLSQNDGTLMTADYAARYPVLTFASGPTNSMRGAAFLSGLKDALVLDVGGTTTDGGMLVGGFPREASFEVSVGGVRTNFRMPDVVSIGLGGGSIVADGGRAVGPRSVGYLLTERALVFGGDTLTASDVAVAAGLACLGDPARVAALDPATVAAARERIRDVIADLVDQLKTSAAPVPVVLVGGGSILVEEPIPGAAEVVRPAHAGVANAIGAAIAQVSGEVDHIYPLDGGATREGVLAAARAAATARAVEAGADPAGIEIVEVDEIPLTYLPSNAVRVRVKAAGELRVARDE